MNSWLPDKKSVLSEVIIEFAWLTVSFVLTAAICYYLFNWIFGQGTLSIQLYDTYFVFSVPIILFTIFFTIAFFLLFLKGISTKFTQLIADLFLLTVGFCLVSSISFLTKEITAQSTVIGWVIYPPLAAIPNTSPESDKVIRLTGILVNSLIAFQLIVTIALGYVAFRWGRQSKAPS